MAIRFTPGDHKPPEMRCSLPGDHEPHPWSQVTGRTVGVRHPDAAWCLGTGKPPRRTRGRKAPPRTRLVTQVDVNDLRAATGHDD